jgi:hypothetical protein
VETTSDDECDECVIDVSLGIAAHFCRLHSGQEVCDEWVKEVVSGKITASEFLDRVESTLTDPGELVSVRSAREELRKKGIY